MIWRCDLVPQYEMYKDEIHEAINRVLSSGRYILSREVEAFEKEFAEYLGVRFGVAVANGTDALTLSLMALGIGPGDEVITTPFTAIPTASAIIDTGAIPVFVDVDPETFLMDISKVKGKLSPRTKAVLPVHIFGNVLNIEALREVVGPTLPIIEDSAQSHGSSINGRQSGSMGTLGTFSFYPTKNLGAYGDGGMVVTNDKTLDKMLRLLRMYGMRDYNHIVINGINSRLDELQAAILRVKLKHLDACNSQRNNIAARYKSELPASLFSHQRIEHGVYSNYHVFVSRFKGDRQSLIDFLAKNEIQTNIYYLIPLHLQQANIYLGYSAGELPAVEHLCSEVIALPLYPELPSETQMRVIQCIEEFNRGNTMGGNNT